MSVIALPHNPKNRRTAFRIYEQINLYYQKLGSTSAYSRQETTENQRTNASPRSESQENDTLHVNISSSGIAFTAREAFVAGDRLRLRILLLSSMTTISCNARVVYCRPSNPYENDRYPYTIGVEFVDMGEAESALLEQHVEQRRKRQRMVNLGYGALALAVLIAPDYAVHLLMEFAHHLFTELLHVLHLMFEYLEMGLDHVVEHHFHTDRHETQVIVFYTLVVSALLLLSWQIRRFSRWLRSRYQALVRLILRKKASASYRWSALTGLQKLKWASVSLSGLVGYVYFLTM